jgi:hypothetical protein
MPKWQLPRLPTANTDSVITEQAERVEFKVTNDKSNS